MPQIVDLMNARRQRRSTSPHPEPAAALDNVTVVDDPADDGRVIA